MIAAGDCELMRRTKPHSQKQKVVLQFKLSKDLRIDLCPIAEFNPKLLDQLDLAQARRRRQLVFGHAVGVETAGEWIPVKDSYRKTALCQLRRARQGRGPRANAGHPAWQRLRSLSR